MYPLPEQEAPAIPIMKGVVFFNVFLRELCFSEWSERAVGRVEPYALRLIPYSLRSNAPGNRRLFLPILFPGVFSVPSRVVLLQR